MNHCATSQQTLSALGVLSSQTGVRVTSRVDLKLAAEPQGPEDCQAMVNRHRLTASFCGGRLVGFVGQRTRAFDTSQTHAVWFRRPCGGNLKRGSSTGNKMPPNISITPVAQVTLNYPLVSADVACAALKCDRARVMALIDEGKIRWAFNFALELSYRCEPRLLANSLANYQSGRVTQWPSGMDEFAAVIKTIFPMVKAGGVATLRAATVARQFSVSIDHLFNLCAAKRIKLAKGTRRCAGPNGSPLVEFASVVKFLKQRRLV